MKSIYKVPKKIPKEAALDIQSICKYFLQRVTGGEKATIGFVSSVAGEGTSTVLLQLARCLARSNKSVLLVDATHDYGLTKMLLDYPKGDVSRISSHGTTQTSVVRETGLKGVSLIPAPFLVNSEQLKGETLEEKIKEGRGTADFIFIDCPPVLDPTSEFRLYSFCDGLIYIVAAHKTRRELIQQAKTKLQQDGINNVIGSILNSRKYFVPGFLYPLF